MMVENIRRWMTLMEGFEGQTGPWYRGADAPEAPHDYWDEPTKTDWHPLDTDNRWIWLTTDPQHAVNFGTVHPVTASPKNPGFIDASDGRFGGGYEGDEAMYDEANELIEQGHDAVVLRGWEGRGLCMIVPQHKRRILSVSGFDD